MIKSTVLAGVLLALAACGSQPASVSIAIDDTVDQVLVFKNVAVFDADSLSVTGNQDVRVEGSKIVSIDPSTADDKSPNATVIDGRGATLVPGLIDMHGHVATTTGPTWEFSLPRPEDNLKAYLYAGVTTVFDPSDTTDDAFERRERVASGELLGPKIFTTGRIITHPGGHPRAMISELAPWWIRWYLIPVVGSGVETVAEAFAEVDERVDAGADAIKIVVDQIPLEAPVLQDELSAAVVKRARERGIRTVAHIGTTADAIAAAEAGVALWVHGVYKERIPDDQIRRLVNFEIPMVTTSEVFDRYGRAQNGEIVPTKLEREIVSREILDSFYPMPSDFDPGPLHSWIELMSKTREVRLDNVRRLHQAGIKILAGSDTQSGVFPGAGLHRELATLVDAGLTPSEAIKSATLDAARYLEATESPSFGNIEVGQKADLLLVSGDPTKNISALMEIREVISNGRRIIRQRVGAAE